MITYKTPDVYIEEVPTLPPSVAGVSTAVPAFIGYTEKAGVKKDENGDHKNELRYKATRIRSMLEYKTLFGGPEMALALSIDDEMTHIGDIELEHYLYYSLDLYFKNGGGPCYIVSVGDYSDTRDKAHFESALGALEKEDEPTLILLTDAIGLDADDYHDLCRQTLSHCAKLGNRFALFDVLYEDSEDPNVIEAHTAAFRTAIGTNHLDYGAAYYPYLKTELGLTYDENRLIIRGLNLHPYSYSTDPNGILITNIAFANPGVIFTSNSSPGIGFSLNTLTLTIYVESGGNTPDEIVNAWNAWGGFKGRFDIQKNGTGTTNITAPSRGTLHQDPYLTLNRLKKVMAETYHQIKAGLSKQHLMLAPCAAMAGIYATVDRERGVWKAPANVSLTAVNSPVIGISDAEQEDLNVDTRDGKSINAIRSFSGRGTLAWGARTLDGNSNEWRYVSVRRLFIMIEESAKRATSFAVFEPNDVNTWTKVASMIDSYLFGLWKQGAMAGAKPENAYFVHVGLGKTMTEQDVLEGRMIVEIGIAAVRPAEFIILRFSHKLQEA